MRRDATRSTWLVEAADEVLTFLEKTAAEGSPIFGIYERLDAALKQLEKES